ncbi:MAG: permease [Desulfurococcales archaeon]|nr:permease [Desulfurococcales archaeon]
MELTVVVIFLLAIGAVILRVTDETVAAILGVVLMVLLTEYTPGEAFSFIDWNVMSILLGMWIITGYLIEGRIPEIIINALSRRVKTYKSFILSMAIISGFLSMFVDNVLVILLLGSIVLSIAKRAGADPFKSVMLIGVSANFMGTALLMGDLPPQLLHSVAGAEFLDFIYFYGKPSSFPLLTLTFIITTYIIYKLYFKDEYDKPIDSGDLVKKAEFNIVTLISVIGFIATVTAMAFRPLIGLPLGFITMAGASFTSITVELIRRRKKELPSFEKILGHVEWRALLFYASLFSLVGGLEDAGVLEEIASKITGVLQAGIATSYTVFYWVAGLLSTFIEHDALLLTFLYIVRDASIMAGVDAWHVYWALVWSATLGSNATVAAAPALYVALTLVESEAKVKIKPKDILRFTIPYALISLAIHYIVTLPFWGMV